MGFRFEERGWFSGYTCVYSYELDPISPTSTEVRFTSAVFFDSMLDELLSFAFSNRRRNDLRARGALEALKKSVTSP